MLLLRGFLFSSCLALPWKHIGNTFGNTLATQSPNNSAATVFLDRERRKVRAPETSNGSFFRFGSASRDSVGCYLGGRTSFWGSSLREVLHRLCVVRRVLDPPIWGLDGPGVVEPHHLKPVKPALETNASHQEPCFGGREKVGLHKANCLTPRLPG